jgi:hypothetical protein
MSDLERVKEKLPNISEDVLRLSGLTGNGTETYPNDPRNGTNRIKGKSGKVNKFNAVKMSESDYQQTIIEYAQLRGWRVAHVRNVRIQRANGTYYYESPVQGDQGLPDLILGRNGEVIFIEVKSDTGKLSDDQKKWIDALAGRVYLARPSNWDIIKIILE